jgi:hypothetical protein
MSKQGENLAFFLTNAIALKNEFQVAQSTLF